MRRLSVLPSLLFALLATPATAQIPLGPAADSHADLYIKMKVAGFSGPVELRRSGARTRIDLSEGGALQAYITDRDKGLLIAMTASGQSRTALVFPLDHAEAVLPLPLDFATLTAAGAQTQAVGASIVNGRSCRLLSFSGYLNQAGMICVTPDNLILRMTSSGRRDPLFEVTDLAEGKQDPKWFRTPPDYQLAVVPGIGGASAPQGAVVEGGAQPPAPGDGPLPKIIYGKPKTQP